MVTPLVRDARSPVPRIAALAITVMAAAGCSGPLYRTSAQWPAARDAIQRVGLLPPLVTVYQEQVSGLLPRLIASDEWSRAAAENLESAFRAELPAAHLAFAEIHGEEREIEDLADLFSAVDLSILRHVYGEMGEEFSERVRGLDYSLGPVDELMERQGIDAAWIVGGCSLVPTGGARVRDAVETVLEVGAAIGGSASLSSRLEKLDIRAALVGKDGSILFFCVIRGGDVPYADPSPDGPADEGDDVVEQARDLRDRAFARRLVRKLLAEYEVAAR